MTILYFIQTIILIIFIYDFQRCVGDNITLSNLNSLIHKFRISSIFAPEEEKISLLFITNQLIKVATAIAYVSLYCLAINIRNYNPKQMFYCIINIVPSLAMNVLIGSRINFICYMFFFLSILMCTNKFINNFKTILLLIISALIAIFFFSISRLIVGRGQSYSTIDYLASYFGNSILCFDYALKNYDFSYLGIRNTFFNVFSFLAKFGILNNMSFNKQFVEYNGFELGNVYGGIYDYFADLRIFGIILFGIIIGFIATYLYLSLYNKKTKAKEFYILIYGKIFYSFFLDEYAGFFFQNLFSLNFLVELLIMWIIFKFLSKQRAFIPININKKMENHYNGY